MHFLPDQLVYLVICIEEECAVPLLFGEFYVHCEDQSEIDRLWNALLDGGEPQQCGWITDRFGVTWQIVPDVLETFLTDEDQAKVQRVTEAFLQMEKFDIPALEAAYAG